MTYKKEDDTAFSPIDSRTVDFADWGYDTVAYVKPVIEDDRPGWGIFAADGRRLGVAADREAAMVAARINDLDPCSVH